MLLTYSRKYPIKRNSPNYLTSIHRVFTILIWILCKILLLPHGSIFTVFVNAQAKVSMLKIRSVSFTLAQEIPLIISLVCLFLKLQRQISDFLVLSVSIW